MKTPAQVRSVLDALGAMGYAEVELAGHYDLAPAELRERLDAAGLRAVSGHAGFDVSDPDWDAYERELAAAAVLGQEYTGLPWWGGPYTEQGFRLLAPRLDEAGARAARVGLRFFYHHHAFEFDSRDAAGRPLFDLLLAATDPALVSFELDLYWITSAGFDPVPYLSRDPGRYPLFHVKDRARTSRSGREDWEDAGAGTLDFRAIFAAGGGDKHYVIEHDDPFLSHRTTPKRRLPPRGRASSSCRRSAGSARGAPGRSRSSGPSPRSPSRPSRAAGGRTRRCPCSRVRRARGPSGAPGRSHPGRA